MDIPSPIGSKPGSRPLAFSTTGLFVAVAASTAIAFFAGVLYANLADSAHNDDGFDIFWQSWDILEKEYYYDLPEDKEMVYGAIQGLLAAADDPYTFFVPPTTAELDRQQTAGEFGGIGAYISQNAEGFWIISQPIADMPAQQAGLRSGDIILTVDGAPIQGWTLDQAVARLRGKPGSTVSLDIYRPSNRTEFTVELTRASVAMQTVEARMIGDIGYIRLFSFNASAEAVLEREIVSVLDQDPHALILDLRGNPGGLLDQAIGVADLFLDEGVIVRQRLRSGEETVYRTASGDIAENLPLAVLIDGGSASASEVVAGALRDRNRAVLIGGTSYGKGSVQHVHDLADGSQLHVTVALWFTPNETLIQGQGLTPDVEVVPSDESDLEEDPVIEAALDYLAAGG